MSLSFESNHNLRWAIYETIGGWNGLSYMESMQDDQINKVDKFFGFDFWVDFDTAQCKNPSVNKLLRALLGPNGRTIYMAMKARQEVVS